MKIAGIIIIFLLGTASASWAVDDFRKRTTGSWLFKKPENSFGIKGFLILLVFIILALITGGILIW